MFLPCRSIRPYKGSNLFSSKHTYKGFEKVWGVMKIRYEISTSVRACMRYAWSSVLVRSTWNLFR